MGKSTSENENQRIQKLHEYFILETSAEQVFDDIVVLAAQICGTSIALVSLVDTDRIWFKAKKGITANEINRDGGFCAEAILHEDVLVVSNALKDSRFSTNPLVTSELHIRFYAGVPLRTSSGEALGTLCVLDREPRELAVDQIESLRALARQVLAQLELRHKEIHSAQILAEAKHIEQLLRQTLDMQTALLNSANVSIIATDDQGIITVFNHTAQILLGYSNAEVVGKFTLSQFHDADEIVVRAAELSTELGRTIDPGFEVFVAKARTGNAREVEWTYIHKDGRRFMVKLSITCLYGADGIIGFLGIAIDITRRKEAELRLKNSEQFTRFALDALSKQYCVLDENGMILAINKTWLNFERERDCDIDKLEIGQNYLALLDAGLADLRGGGPYAEHILAVMAGNESGFSFEYSYRMQSLQQWFVGKVISFPDHELGSVIVTHENITEHKHLQHRFRQAVESAPYAIVMVNQIGTILMVNLQTEKSFGYSRQELVGQPVEILVPERFRGRHAGSRQAFFADPKSRPMGAGRELYGLRKDSSEFPVEIGLGLIDDDENGTIILSSIIDISERKNANDLLKSALEEKDVLLKEVYHRVKNNLQVVSSLINLQARSVKNAEAVILLKQSADRIKAMALLHEKLYQSKDLARIDFNEYIHSLVEHLKFGYGMHPDRININLKIDHIALDVDTAIPCGLIINELVSNALKHAFPGDRQGEIGITFTQNQDQCILTITDNGIGFPADLDFQKSTSLGLQLVNSLTNQLLGDLTIDRTAGSVITLRFTYSA